MSDCTSLSYCKLDTLMVANMELGEAHAEIERLHKIELQFLALQEERVRWFADNEWLTADNERLRAALHNLQGCDIDNAAQDIISRALEPKPQPAKCAECDRYYADPPSKLCPGCQAYREHQS